MVQISGVMMELLIAQGLHDRAVGAGTVMGMDAGSPLGERTSPLADAAHREEPRVRSEWEKAGRSRNGAARQVSRHEGDVHGGGMGMVKIEGARIASTAPWLLIIDGDKA